MFISERCGDVYYIATPGRCGRYLWSRVPHRPGPEIRVDASRVPERIRERAYDMFEGDRLRARGV